MRHLTRAPGAGTVPARAAACRADHPLARGLVARDRMAHGRMARDRMVPVVGRTRRADAEKDQADVVVRRAASTERRRAFQDRWS